VKALSGVTFEVAEGECLALVGENGAGKSTLMKILCGVWPHGSYEGEIFFNGENRALRSTIDGRRAGISIIHQELCLFPKLTVAENLFLTEAAPYNGEPSQRMLGRVNWKLLNERAEGLFRELGFSISPTALVEELSVAERQLVEIARACHHRAKLLILDEPTSALSRAEVEHLFKIIKRMRDRRMSFIYISHKLDEVFTLADRIVVLRDGKTVGELPKTVSEKEVIRQMVGRPLVEGRRESFRQPEEVLRVENLRHVSPTGASIIDSIGFRVGRGEVVGIAGLMGAGRSELLRSLMGLLPGKRQGEIQFLGQRVNWRGIDEAMAAGVAFVPEDRKKDGLFLDLPIAFNLSVSSLDRLRKKWGWLDLAREREMCEELRQGMGIKISSLEKPVRVLSGGNQQKVLLSKMVARRPKLLLLDEPTRGIDVGAKEEIYAIIRRLAREGVAILVVSSELPEILTLSDRVLVLKEGRPTATLDNHQLTQEVIMSYAAGGTLGAS